MCLRPWIVPTTHSSRKHLYVQVNIFYYLANFFQGGALAITSSVIKKNNSKLKNLDFTF